MSIAIEFKRKEIELPVREGDAYDRYTYGPLRAYLCGMRVPVWFANLVILLG